MTHQRLAYHDADTAAEMHRDCSVAAERIRLSRPRTTTLAERATAPVPGIGYAGSEAVKPEITVSEAAARLAAALHLHLE